MTTIQPIMKHIDSFVVTGFTVRTQNSDEFNEERAKLPKLWQQFLSSNPATNLTSYGVYSDYESDAKGYYNVTVGANDNPAPNLHSVKINSGNYLVFQRRGPMPQAVIEAWEQVWAYFSKGCVHQRSFMTDFEAYSNGDEVSVYIGVK